MLKGFITVAGVVAKHYKTIKNTITKATQKAVKTPQTRKAADQKKSPAQQSSPTHESTTTNSKELMKKEMDRHPSVSETLGKHIEKGSAKEAPDSWVGKSPNTPNSGNNSDAIPNRQRSLSLDDKGGPAL